MAITKSYKLINANVNNLSSDMDDKCWIEKPSRF